MRSVYHLTVENPKQKMKKIDMSIVMTPLVFYFLLAAGVEPLISPFTGRTTHTTGQRALAIQPLSIVLIYLQLAGG